MKSRVERDVGMTNAENRQQTTLKVISMKSVFQFKNLTQILILRLACLGVIWINLKEV